MMTLQIVSHDKDLLNTIADDLLKEKLIANAFLTEEVTTKTIDKDDKVITSTQYSLKGISKSLLFNRINQRLRAQYGKEMPLLYSEPIIMIDPEQTEEILSNVISI